MSQSERDNRIIVKGPKARAKLLEGAKAAYETVTTTFGAKGRNVLIEKPFGRPMLTRDGVTVARDTYFKDRAKNMGAQFVLEASETTNRIAGDGTTATVALSYHLMRRGSQAIAAGSHPMDIKKELFDSSYVILDKLKTLVRSAKKSQLEQVATTSCGDPLLGQLIAEAISYIGSDGGIITEKAYIQDVEREYIDGYFLQNGFEALQAGRKELVDPSVIVTSKRLSSSADAVELLTGIMKVKNIQPQQGQIPRLLFIGNIEDAAYNLIVDNINRSAIDAIIIKSPPQFGNLTEQLLEDIAIYANCTLLTDSTNLKTFNESYIGEVNRVMATKSESTLFSNNQTEAVKVRVQEIKDQIETETSDPIIEKLRDRIAKLEGKIALFRIGGATDTEKEEKEFRVEDAIQATRAAFSEGIVAGGAVTLLELSKSIDGIYKEALQDVFKKLLRNADLPVELKLQEALKARIGYGYNLKADDTLVDMKQVGILDAALVVEQVIKNATSAAAEALTTEILLIFEDRKE